MYSLKFSGPRLLALFVWLLLFGPRFVDAQITSPSFSVAQTKLPDLSLAVAKWGDYDNDGRLDLFLSGWDTNYTPHTYLFHNDGNGVFSSVAAAFTDLVYSSAEWADLDNDGYLDLVLAGYDPASSTNPYPVRVFRNLGNGRFALVTTLGQVESAAVASGDYDKDGKTDIAVIGDGPQTGVFRNLGNWTFLQKFQTTVALSGSVSWVDVDGDGYLDLFVAGAVSNGVFQTHLYHYTRDGNFTETGPLPVPGAQALIAAWGDYDGDGQPDLLYSGYSTNTDGIYTGYFSAIYRNNNGTLQDIGLNLPQLVGSSGAWGDFDNDGKLDFYLAGMGSTGRFAGLFRNAGTNSFVNLGTTLIPNGDGWAAWADFDNDGALDLVYGGDTDEGPNVMRTQLLHNDVTLPNTPPTAPNGLSAFVTNGTVVLSWNAATDAEQ
ncbi:MAG: FG-GAP repeat domain-containing protein, partial [Limisphaerales bacterium]